MSGEEKRRALAPQSWGKAAWAHAGSSAWLLLLYLQGVRLRRKKRRRRRRRRKRRKRKSGRRGGAEEEENEWEAKEERRGRRRRRRRQGMVVDCVLLGIQR